MGHYEDERARSCQAGRLAEEFCRDRFGIVENGRFEIKASAWCSYQVVLRVCQLIESLDKQYVIVRYRRRQRRLKRGPRKGTYVPDEKIKEAFGRDHRKVVYVVRGIDFMRIIRDNRIRVLMTKYRRDAKWAPYWTVPSRLWPGEEMARTDEVTVMGNPLDPPLWLREDWDPGAGMPVSEMEEAPF